MYPKPKSMFAMGIGVYDERIGASYTLIIKKTIIFLAVYLSSQLLFLVALHFFGLRIHQQQLEKLSSIGIETNKFDLSLSKTL